MKHQVQRNRIQRPRLFVVHITPLLLEAGEGEGERVRGRERRGEGSDDFL